MVQAGGRFDPFLSGTLAAGGNGSLPATAAKPRRETHSDGWRGRGNLVLLAVCAARIASFLFSLSPCLTCLWQRQHVAAATPPRPVRDDWAFWGVKTRGAGRIAGRTRVIRWTAYSLRTVRIALRLFAMAADKTT